MKRLKTVSLSFIFTLFMLAFIGTMLFVAFDILGILTARHDLAYQSYYSNYTTLKTKNQYNIHDNMYNFDLIKHDEPLGRPLRAEQVYGIKWGDNLCGISRTYGVSVDEIASYNQIKNPDLIWAGSSIIIPVKKND